MQRTHFVAVLLFSIGLSACATESAQRPVASGPPGLQPPQPVSSEDRMICTEERPTGSNIAHTVCRSEAEAQHEGDAGKAWMERTPGHTPYAYPDDPFKR